MAGHRFNRRNRALVSWALLRRPGTRRQPFCSPDGTSEQLWSVVVAPLAELPPRDAHGGSVRQRHQRDALDSRRHGPPAPPDVPRSLWRPPCAVPGIADVRRGHLDRLGAPGLALCGRRTLFRRSHCADLAFQRTVHGQSRARREGAALPERHLGATKVSTKVARQPKLSAVVPCYNESAGLNELISRLVAVCEAEFPDDYEIVLVNDGSRDATWPIIARYAHELKHVVGVNLSRNYGHQIALTAGLETCRGELVLILDADLQDPPELLPKIIAKLQEGYDVVYGQRVRSSGETWIKKVTAQ